MRIRTDGEYAHREDMIENAARELDCNKTRAVLVACDLVGEVLPKLENALAEADIRPSEKQKLANALSTRHVTVDVEREIITVDTE